MAAATRALAVLVALVAATLGQRSALRNRSPVRTVKAGVDVMAAALVSQAASCQDAPKHLDNNLWWRMKELENLKERMKGLNETLATLKSRMQEPAVAQILTVPGDECEAPFKPTPQGCLWLHKSPGLAWEAARRRCRQAGADLASPPNLQAIRDYLQAEIGKAWFYVWVGGTMTGHRTWTYVDGSVGEAQEDEWHVTLNPGSCTALNGGRDYRAMAWDCQDPNWFLCQKG